MANSRPDAALSADALGGSILAYTMLLALPTVCVYLGSIKSSMYPRTPDSKELTLRNAALLPVLTSTIVLLMYLLAMEGYAEIITKFLTACVFIEASSYAIDNISPSLERFLPVSQQWLIRALAYLVALNCYWEFNDTWLFKNILTLTYCTMAVEMSDVRSFKVGVALVVGFLFFDMLWVFYTQIMEAIVSAVGAPMVLQFPQDYFSNSDVPSNFVSLGVTDIVFPGQLLSVLLRFDNRSNHQEGLYFRATLASYALGLAISSLVSITLAYNQPTMLYLTPACVITPLTLAITRGELQQLIDYEDNLEHHNKRRSRLTRHAENQEFVLETNL